MKNLIKISLFLFAAMLFSLENTTAQTAGNRTRPLIDTTLFSRTTFTAKGTNEAFRNKFIKVFSGGDTSWTFVDVNGNQARLSRGVLTGVATLNFPSTTATTVSDLTITVTGAVLGDAVMIGVPSAAITATSSYEGWVSAANTVTIRYSPKATEDPASGVFKAIIQH